MAKVYAVLIAFKCAEFYLPDTFSALLRVFKKHIAVITRPIDDVHVRKNKKMDKLSDTYVNGCKRKHIGD